MKNTKKLAAALMVAATVLSGCSTAPGEVTDQTKNIVIEGDGGSGLESWGQTEAETEAETVASVDTEVSNLLASMTLEEKVAQLFILTPEMLTGYETVTAAGQATQTAINQYPVGGMIYMGQNITGPDQVKEMLANTQTYAMERIHIPIFLSVDEEGGEVARIGQHADVFGITRIGNMSDIGATGDTAQARQVGETIGQYLNDLGFNMDFAPDADVLTNPDNQVVRYRSFGSDPTLVSNMALEVYNGLESQNVIGVYKHFPGHGATVGDTHEGYAYTEKTLEEIINNELIPFINGAENGVDVIMAAHIACPNITGSQIPTSLSETMITEVLRNQIGFQGIVVSDAMNMGAIQSQYTPEQSAVTALKAGVDMILMPADFKVAYDGVLNAISQGELSEERINESVTRILKVKLENLSWGE